MTPEPLRRGIADAGYLVLSELIVMLTNKRRRALHDFIAGTVVIRDRFAPPQLYR